ncbi:hypothetical protein BGZ97_007775, partial [Linnemannia gamsii]
FGLLPDWVRVQRWARSGHGKSTQFSKKGTLTPTHLLVGLIEIGTQPGRNLRVTKLTLQAIHDCDAPPTAASLQTD